MGILDIFFKAKQNKQDERIELKFGDNVSRTPECLHFIEYLKFAEKLLNREDYISKKEYMDKLLSYKDTVRFFG